MRIPGRTIREAARRTGIVLACMAPFGAFADCDPAFTQVNESGFGVQNNRYIWAMEVFNDRLYAGTINQVGGGQIWRYNGVTWAPVVTAGLNSKRNIGTRSMAVCHGKLYAGTDNVTEGAQLWSTSDGQNWEAVLTNGGISPDVRSIRALYCTSAFDDTEYLYVGMMATETPGKVLRTADGINFEPITTDGFNRKGNRSIHAFAMFQGALYAATSNTHNGLQVWRSFDGRNFEVVVGTGADTPSGFGHEESNSATDFQEFQGRLFLGDINALGGFGLWVTSDGLNWSQVGEDGFGYQGNDYAWQLAVYEDALWLGVLNSIAFFNPGQRGASLWRSFDGDNWTELVGGPPAEFMRWGFNDSQNIGIRTLTEFRGKLYIGTAQDARPGADVAGAQVWMWPGEACPDESAKAAQ